MSVVDNSTTTVESPGNMTELAVAFGRVETGLGFVNQGIGELKEGQKEQATQTLKNTVAITRIDGVLVEHTNLLAARAPQRFGWPVIVGVVTTAIFGLAGTIFGVISAVSALK